ncbi:MULTISPECIES: hypothetical protein [unclassified Lysobacter]|uniref:hypothetical protein n=1 Tax=unclassified Lysobacter TaxID=2635362 RepID=UPI001BEA0EDD|nr:MULTISPECIES: hypothetical protein [unclassified Lysobacter]MBT2748379.1 hypothetical protein [Lysobacter sp. ISL-42]MBT2749854.1 hypothetical protein [Lysobacter sp. ISL-50]MBT2781182.1 hypothetical protein [Lysobacter sp. ISL-52]
MLKRYLNWFDNEPADELLSATGSSLQPKLVALGAMYPAKRAIRSLCVTCGLMAVRQMQEYDDHALVCVACGGRVEVWPADMKMRVRHVWLPGELAKRLSDTVPVVLMPNRLWRLAQVSIRQQSVTVYLLRCTASPHMEPVIAALERDLAGRQVVLTTKEEFPVELSDGQRLMIPLSRVARLEAEGLEFDYETFANTVVPVDALAVAAGRQRRWFKLSPDGSRLRLQDQELVLHRKQCRFVLAIAEAHDMGEERPKQSWVLDRSGHSRENTSLKQICRRPEIARFIDWSQGEVAIRKVALPHDYNDAETAK